MSSKRTEEESLELYKKNFLQVKSENFFYVTASLSDDIYQSFNYDHDENKQDLYNKVSGVLMEYTLNGDISKNAEEAVRARVVFEIREFKFRTLVRYTKANIANNEKSTEADVKSNLRNLNKIISSFGLELAEYKTKSKYLPKWEICFLEIIHILREQFRDALLCNDFSDIIPTKIEGEGKNETGQALIGLTHFYLEHSGDGVGINEKNMKEIAIRYGYEKPNSGKSIKDEFIRFSEVTNRKELTHKKRSDNAHKERMENALQYFSENKFPRAHERARSEYDAFMSLYNKFYK